MDIHSYLQTANEVIANPTPPANATITFRSGGSDVTFDDLGNPVVDGGVDTVLKCWLKQARPPQKDVQAGLNLDAEYFHGELIDPKLYPFPIQSDGKIIVNINGRLGTFTQLIFTDSPASHGWGINKYHGQKIAGWVQFEEGQ
jgi:hypothetical protein